MSAVEWSRPRTTPMAGRRKATERFCLACNKFHRTHRHPAGVEICPNPTYKQTVCFPHIAKTPTTYSNA